MSIDLSLDRICKLLAHFPVPYNRPTIHVAGTNGKGSVCAYVSSILAAADPPLVVGRFNSPHLLNWLDGISIQNQPVSPGTFEPARREIETINTKHDIGASNFEQYTCMALLIFERMRVDVVVLEVGMGGRLDATNVVPDECILVSALTSVDLDHQAFLGDTVEQITREKAAIARKGKPFILGPQVHRQVELVAREIVEATGGELFPPSSVVPVEWDEELDGPQRSAGAGIGVPLLQPVQISMPGFTEPVRALLPLHGAHQYSNLGIAAGIISALLTHPSVQQHVPELKLSERLTPVTIARGVRATRWPGRLSYHNITLPADSSTSHAETRLLVLADGAHNPASATALAAYLSSMLEKTGNGPLNLTYILGLSHSPPKTPEQTLGPLIAVHSHLSKTRPVRLGAALLAFTQPDRMPWIRGVPPATMRAAIDTLMGSSSPSDSHTAVEIYEDQPEEVSAEQDEGVDAPPRTEHVERALRWAAGRRREGEDTLVVLAGSLYLVADFYRLLQKYGQADEIWGAN